MPFKLFSICCSYQTLTLRNDRVSSKYRYSLQSQKYSKSRSLQQASILRKYQKLQESSIIIDPYSKQYIDREIQILTNISNNSKTNSIKKKNKLNLTSSTILTEKVDNLELRKTLGNDFEDLNNKNVLSGLHSDNP